MALTISGTGIVQSGSFNSASIFGFKNRIINGAANINQRYGITSASMPATVGTYTGQDRWSYDMVGTPAGSFSTITTGPTGLFNNSFGLYRDNASTSTSTISMAQAIETQNCIDLAGDYATLSFWAQAQAGFSAASSYLNSKISFGTGTDQTVASMRNNTWTGLTSVTTSTAITTTWTRYTITVSVPAGTTQVGVQLYWNPTGTAPSGGLDSVRITGIQLEKGSTATSYDFLPAGVEEILCKRYYQSDILIATGGGATPASTNRKFFVTALWPVPFRATPTMSLVNGVNITNTTGATWDYLSSSRGRFYVLNSIANDIEYVAYYQGSAEL